MTGIKCTNKNFKIMSWSVITYLFGEGDLLRDVLHKDDGVSYICVTDNHKLDGKVEHGWRYVVDHDLHDMSDVVKSCYVKTHPFKYSNCQYVITLDSSIQIIGSLRQLFDVFVSAGFDLGLKKHPSNDRQQPILYDLAQRVRLGCSEEQYCAQISYMRKQGCDFSRHDAIESGFIVSRRVPSVIGYFDEVWMAFSRCSISRTFSSANTNRNDRVVNQAIFGWIAGQRSAGLKILCLEQSILESDSLQLYEHKSYKKRGVGKAVSYFLNHHINGFQFSKEYIPDMQVHDYKIDQVIFSIDNHKKSIYSGFWFTVSQMLSFWGIRPVLYVCGSKDEREIYPGELSRQYGDVYWLEHDGPSVLAPDKYHLYGQLGRIYGLKMCNGKIAMISDIDLYPLCNYNEYLLRYKNVFDKYKVINFQTTYNKSGRYCAGTIVLDVASAIDFLGLRGYDDFGRFVNDVSNKYGSHWGTDESFLNMKLPKSPETKIRIINRVDRVDGLKYSEKMRDGQYNDMHAPRPYEVHSKSICDVLRRVNPNIQEYPLSPDVLSASDWADYCHIANPKCFWVNSDHVFEVKTIPHGVTKLIIGGGDTCIGNREITYLRNLRPEILDIYCMYPGKSIQNDPSVRVIPLGTIARQRINNAIPYAVANRYVEPLINQGGYHRKNRILCCFRDTGIYYGCHYRSSVRRDWLRHISNNVDVDTIISRTNRDYMRTMLQYDYVLCPDGLQTQTYRTFEALSCGCIPVVRDDYILRESLRGLPVIFISNPNHISLSYLNAVRDKVLEKTGFERLTLKYWMNILRLPHKPRYTVLTYSIGSYNPPHNIAQKTPDVDYICVTNRADCDGKCINGWIMQYDDAITAFSYIHAVYYVKQHVYQYVKTDIVIVIDASVAINGSLDLLVNKFVDGGFDFGLVKHKGNNADNPIVRDLEAWANMCGDKSIVDAQKKYMAEHGCDLVRRSLIQGGFAIYRKTALTQRYLAEVYRHIVACTPSDVMRHSSDRCRVVDQSIRGWIADKYKNIYRASIMCIESNIMHTGPLMLYYHNSNRPRRTGGSSEWFLNEKSHGFGWVK